MIDYSTLDFLGISHLDSRAVDNKSPKGTKTLGWQVKVIRMAYASETIGRLTQYLIELESFRLQ